MSIRQERLGDQIRDILAGYFTGGRLADPRLASVTLTGVDVSRDLQVAKVFFTQLSDAVEQSDVKQGLRSASGLFRTRLAKELRLRRTPELRFIHDNSIDRACRIEQLIREAGI